jgi:hypothetical protein
MAEETKTNITKEHERAFDGVRNAENIALVSCFVNGEPAVAIAAINHLDDGMVSITPLFVSVTPLMKIVDHDGVPC